MVKEKKKYSYTVLSRSFTTFYQHVTTDEGATVHLFTLKFPSEALAFFHAAASQSLVPDSPVSM